MDPASLADMPSGAPPNGVASNFEHPASLAKEIYIGLGFCTGLTTAFLLPRFWIKLKLKRPLNTEDFSVVISFLSIVAFDITSFLLLQPGGILGFHVWDIRLSDITKSGLQESLLTLNFYVVSVFFAKLSLFSLYLRIFGPNKNTRLLVFVGIAVCAGFYAASVIVNCILFMPKPGQPNTTQFWLARAQRGQLESKVLTVVQAVFGSSSDIYLLFIPMYSISKLQLPLQRKVGVCMTFTIGLIAIACSLASLALRVKDLNSEDTSWNAVGIYILSQAEIAAGLICNCILSFPSYFRGRFQLKKKFDFQSFARYFSWNSSASANPPERSSHQAEGGESYKIEVIRREAPENQFGRPHDDMTHHGPWVQLNEVGSDEERALR